jgi:HK97 gp10 family phage protein
MAEAINITITNLPQIRAAFGQAPGLMVRSLNIAIKKSLFTIESISKSNTPVDTGRLRSSTISKFSNLSGEVGTHTNYDLFVHNGTRFMKARPYLYDAVKSSDDKIQNFFTEAVDSVLSDIGSKT